MAIRPMQIHHGIEMNGTQIDGLAEATEPGQPYTFEQAEARTPKVTVAPADSPPDNPSTNDLWIVT